MKKLVAAAAIGLLSALTWAGAASADPPVTPQMPPPQAFAHACDRFVDPHPPFCLGRR
jgi:hypothetical protein